jgi:hypothetical protein
MSHLLNFNFLFKIEEEDLILLESENEGFKNENNSIQIYEAEYLDMAANFVVFNKNQEEDGHQKLQDESKSNLEDEISISNNNSNNSHLSSHNSQESLTLEKEILERLKFGNIFTPSILGVCEHSNLGTGIILEKPKGELLNNLISNKEMNFIEKVELIKKLISLFDYANSRGIYFSSIGLNLNDFFYDVKSEKLSIIKFPLFTLENISQDFDSNLSSWYNNENIKLDSLINMPPEFFSSQGLNSNFSKECLNEKNDSWNLGLLIYQILECDHLIFSNFESLESREKIIENLRHLSKEEKNKSSLSFKLNLMLINKLNSLNYNQYLKNILKKLLKVNPKQRSSAKLIKQLFRQNHKLIIETSNNENLSILKNYKTCHNPSAEKCNNFKHSYHNYSQSAIKMNTNFYLNESAYPINNEISLMEISRDDVEKLNFNLTTVNGIKLENKKLSKNLLDNYEPTDTTEDQVKKEDSNNIVNSEYDKENLTSNIIDESQVKKETNHNENNEDLEDNNDRIPLLLNEDEKQSESLNHSREEKNKLNELIELETKEEMIEKIFDTKKKLSQINFIEDNLDINNKESKNYEFESKDKIITPICGEINSEGENIIQFEEVQLNNKDEETKNEQIITDNTNLLEDESQKKIEDEQDDQIINFDNTNLLQNESDSKEVDGNLKQKVEHDSFINKVNNEEISNLKLDDIFNEKQNKFSNVHTDQEDVLKIKEYNSYSSKSLNISKIDKESFECSISINLHTQEKFQDEKNQITINRLEELANDYSITGSDRLLEEISEIILSSPPQVRDIIQEKSINISLWEALLNICFKYLENDDIKSHHVISYLLYSTIDKVYSPSLNPNKFALANFHYAKSIKDYSSNYPLALHLFLESLKYLEKSNEKDTKIGIQVKFFLGSLYDDMGRSEESIQVLKEVLNKQIEIYSENNTFTARTLNCLGISEDNRGNYRQAKEYYNRAYTIFKHLSFGLETIDSVKVLNNLASIYFKWEDYMTCIKFYLKVLEVYLSANGEYNSYVAITYYNLGNCYFMLNNAIMALEALKKALEIFSKQLGFSHPQTAMCMKTLGDVYFSLNDTKNSLDMFNQCLGVFLEKFGDDSDLYITTLNKIRKLKLM